MWPFRRKPLPLGQRGEQLAARHLRRQGLKILARNYRCPVGEIDLILLDRSTRKLGAATIVFVEVKARTSDHYTDPEAAVNAEKKRRLRKIANYYVGKHNAQDYTLRFDIVAVICPDGETPTIRHTPEAF
jgi:putative endonuclease